MMLENLTKSKNPINAAHTTPLFLINRGAITGLLAKRKSQIAKKTRNTTPTASIAMIDPTFRTHRVNLLLG